MRCSFCGKPGDQVKKLIAGPGVYICDECVELCNDIVRDAVGAPMPGSTADSVEVPRHELTGGTRTLDQAVGAVGTVADEAGSLARRLHRRLQDRAVSPLDEPPPGPDPEGGG